MHRMLTSPVAPPDTTERGAYVLILGHRCVRCGHAWRPRDIAIFSFVCPLCKSPRWTQPKRKKHG
jgi:predicted Zn-ribbon and HTH transcriptional regulator